MKEQDHTGCACKHKLSFHMAFEGKQDFPRWSSKILRFNFSTSTHTHSPLCFSLHFYLQPSKCILIITQAFQSNLECSFGRAELSGEQTTEVVRWILTRVIANVSATGRTCLPAVLLEQGALYKFTTQIQTNSALETMGPINLLK